MSVNAVDNFAFLGLGVWGDGETWACGSVSGFRARCAGRSSDDGFGMGRIGRGDGWVHERDGRGTELCLSRDDVDGAAEDVDGCRGGRHVVLAGRCCRR